jgi:predicted permease
VMLDEASKNADRLRRELMDRIRAVPGVQVAGSIDDLPLSTFQDKGYLEIEGQPSRLKHLASVRETGAEYFRAMQVPLIAGRYLHDNDIAASTAGWPKAVVVSGNFAKRYFRGQNAVGHRLRINGSPWSPIVGVVGDVRHSSLEEAPEPIVYCQNGLADSVAIQTIGPSEAIVASIRKTASDLSAGFTVTDVQTMDRYIDQASSRRRFQTVVLTSFAGVAMVLALVGLYGLLSYGVRQRTAEIGVRMALGATRRVVVAMIVFHGLRLTSAGLVIGVCAALALTRAMASFLYGVRAVDPLTFVAVPVFVIAVAAVACMVPAWKAACIDPVSALRHQ